MIRKFRSMTEIRKAAEESGVFASLRAADDYRHSNRSWFGGESAEQTFQRSLVGDRTLVPEAEKLIRKLNTKVEVARRVFTPSAAGPICIAPEILSGSPTPFRRLSHQQDERAPITILPIITSSAAVSAQTLMKRGTAVLALVMALSQVRPVTLHAVNISDGFRDDSGETIFATQITTAPLDLARAAYALTSQGFCRFLNYELATKLNDFRGGWPKSWGYGRNGDPKYMARLAKILSPDPAHTLVIAPAEAGDELVTQPVEWVNKQIQKFTQRDE